MEYRYQLNSDDYASYSRYLMEGPDFKKKTRTQGAIAALAVLIVGLISAFVMQRDIPVTAIVTLIAALAIFFLFPWIVRGGSKLALLNAVKDEGETMFREMRMWVEPDCIRIEADEGEQVIQKVIARDEIEETAAYEGILFLHLRNGNLFMVPERVFPTREEKDAFLKIKA